MKNVELYYEARALMKERKDNEALILLEKFTTSSLDISKTDKDNLSAVFSPIPGKYLNDSIKLFILLGYILIKTILAYLSYIFQHVLP